MTLTKAWLQRFGWPQTLITGHPLAIAHRGASDYAPENTLKSFRIAADLCSEMWELDIRLSSDGVCVVSHDDNPVHAAGHDVSIAKTRWDDIAKLCLPEGQRVSRLEQVIALARETGCGLYIEIKSDGAGPKAWELLRQAGFRFACLASFNTGWIRELRDAGCDYPLGVLVPTGAEPFAYIDDVSPEIVHLCWRDASPAPHELLSDDLMQRLIDHGHQIVTWDEVRTNVLDALWDKPIMGICSNRPELLKPYRPDPARPIDIVCHRGANKLAPENTLEAARICIDQRFQHVELDVRTTSDGALVVVHDAALDRTTNGSGLVIDKTLGEIEKLDAGGWFREGTAGQHIPTLAQFLGGLSGRSGVYVEIKHADPSALLSVVSAAGMLERCFFWGYDTDALRWLRAQSGEITLMAPRWMYGSVSDAISAYGAQIVEFDVEKDDLSDIDECRAQGARSMIFSKWQRWQDLASCLEYQPDLVNLDYPDRFKILVSYPLVHTHFQAMLRGRSDG